MKEVRMYRTIVVGTDGSPTAEGAVAAAAGLAHLCGAKLHVVTAFKVSMFGVAAGRGGAPLTDTTAAVTMQQEAAKEVGERALSSYSKDLEGEAHAVNGDAVSAILDVAEAVGADLVVVGSKGMHGSRRFIGSVPNSVSHGASCAVLIIKTD
jgi:nucleotide-binding universal stress UspA family protein